MSKREEILAATKTLFWQKGYEATSPSDIQKQSHAGQGSFYHHFSSKEELACVAIQEVVDERIADFETAMRGAGSFKTRLSRYIAQNREPLLGCRVGRLVWDSAVQKEALRKPLQQYFVHLERRMIELLKAEQAAGRVVLGLPAKQIALVIISVVQGSFTVSRALKTTRATEARTALLAVLNVLVLDQ